jgi:hypothetical protein
MPGDPHPQWKIPALRKVVNVIMTQRTLNCVVVLPLTAFQRRQLAFYSVLLVLLVPFFVENVNRSVLVL